MRALELRCALAGSSDDMLDVELVEHKVDHGEFVLLTVTDEFKQASHYLTRETAGELYAWLAEALHTIT